MGELLRLAERCEQVTGPDRELDREIKLALEIGKPWTRSTPEAARVWALHYTASLDAAMTLVPEGFHIDLRVRADDTPPIAGLKQMGHLSIRQSDLVSETSEAATAALALCAAALRSHHMSREG